MEVVVDQEAAFRNARGCQKVSIDDRDLECGLCTLCQGRPVLALEKSSPISWFDKPPF